MESSVDRDELEALPFIKRLPDGGRALILLPYYDHTAHEWWMGLPDGSGGVRAGKVINVASGSYQAVVPASAANDFPVPLLTLVLQHLSFPNLVWRLDGFESDLQRCAAILHKYHVISELRSNPGPEASLLAASELEYLLLLLRSLYDVLQSVVCGIGELLTPPDGTKHEMQQLPPSFAKVVLNGEQFRSKEEICERWKTPAPLAAWYVEEAPFFRQLRTLRDAIAHHGQEVPTIYPLAEGLAVDVTSKPWSEFAVWSGCQLFNGKLGPLRLIFAGFIMHAIRASERFVGVMRGITQLPSAIHPEMRVFLTSPFTKWLVSLDETIANPWEGASRGPSAG